MTTPSTTPSTTTFPSDIYRLPFHLENYIDSIRDQLKPPVGNKMIYGLGCHLKVMVVGGPNIRTDYHINQGEEWFYQFKGDMCLKIVKDGIFQDVVIREGDHFVLPGNTPHSPQRLPNTLGLVIERQRYNELDGLRWYCAKCHAVVFEDFFTCEDLGSQLKVKITDYYGSESTRTCKQCKTIDRVPNVDASALKSVTDILRVTRPAEVLEDELTKLLPSHSDYSSKILSSGVAINSSDPQSSFPSEQAYPAPFSLNQWIQASQKNIAASKNIAAFGEVNFEKKGHTTQSEFLIRVAIGSSENNVPQTNTRAHEVFYYQLKGELTLHIEQNSTTNDIVVKEGECVLLPPHLHHHVSRAADTYGLVIENRAV